MNCSCLESSLDCEEQDTFEDNKDNEDTFEDKFEISIEDDVELQMCFKYNIKSSDMCKVAYPLCQQNVSIIHFYRSQISNHAKYKFSNCTLPLTLGKGRVYHAERDEASVMQQPVKVPA